jgi:hypothetical protein
MIENIVMNDVVIKNIKTYFVFISPNFISVNFSRNGTEKYINADAIVDMMIIKAKISVKIFIKDLKI